jgi:hypothetical protein
MDTWLSILSIGIGIAGMVYAVMTNREKAKIENLIRSELRGLAGNICKIRQSSAWAFWHFNNIQALVLKLSESEEKKEILKLTQLGHGDAAASDRMLTNLLNEVLITQDGLFNTKEIHHPEEKELVNK